MSARSRRSSLTPRPSAARETLPQDELSASNTPARVTSRRSSVDTPYARLRQLAGAIQKPSTPLQRDRTPGVGPSGRRRTPDTTYTARSGGAKPGRPIPSKQAAPSTPHALRALRQRRAAAAAASTPGRERRKSGRPQRETPRDVLRALSRLESRRTQPPQPSSTAANARAPGSGGSRRSTQELNEESDDELEPRPDLTLPVDDDDSFQTPPRLSQGMEEEFTQASIEGPRRDHAELGRYARESLRLSDQFGDVGDFDEGGDDNDGGFSINVEDVDGLDAEGLLGDRTEDLGALVDQRQSLDPSLLAPGDAENSFALEIPADLDTDADENDQDEDMNDEGPGGFQDDGMDEALEFDQPTDTLQASQAFKPPTSFGKPGKRAAKVSKVSRYGIEYPSLPAAMVKKMTAAALRAAGNSKTRVSREILAAIVQASDWFFEQTSEDVAAYADHARRKTIDESDVLTLMRRQRVLNASTTPFSLAQKHLPRELLQDIRMVPPTKEKKPGGRKRQALETVEEESEESD